MVIAFMAVIAGCMVALVAYVYYYKPDINFRKTIIHNHLPPPPDYGFTSKTIKTKRVVKGETSFDIDWEDDNIPKELSKSMDSVFLIMDELFKDVNNVWKDFNAIKDAAKKHKNKE